jgi:hypothetical protein
MGDLPSWLVASITKRPTNALNAKTGRREGLVESKTVFRDYARFFKLMSRHSGVNDIFSAGWKMFI